MDTPTPTPAQLADEYAALDRERDALALRTAAVEDRMRQIKKDLSRVVPEGVDTLVITAPGGAKLRVTPTETDIYSPATGKADMFWQWVRINGALDLVQRRISTTAVADYAKTHGHLPPFVDRITKRDTRITVTQPAA